MRISAATPSPRDRKKYTIKTTLITRVRMYRLARARHDCRWWYTIGWIKCGAGNDERENTRRQRPRVGRKLANCAGEKVISRTVFALFFKILIIYIFSMYVFR